MNYHPSRSRLVESRPVSEPEGEFFMSAADRELTVSIVVVAAAVVASHLVAAFERDMRLFMGDDLGEFLRLGGWLVELQGGCL